MDCYYYDQPNNRVGYYIRPEKIPSTGNRNNDGCYGNGLTGSGVFGDQPEAIMQGGCYLTVTKPFATCFAFLVACRSRSAIKSTLKLILSVNSC